MFLAGLVIIKTFGIISCSNSGTQATITFDNARTIFLEWIDTQELKEDSVGIFLSEISAGETVGAEIFGEEMNAIRHTLFISHFPCLKLNSITAAATASVRTSMIQIASMGKFKMMIVR